MAPSKTAIEHAERFVRVGPDTHPYFAAVIRESGAILKDRCAVAFTEAEERGVAAERRRIASWFRVHPEVVRVLGRADLDSLSALLAEGPK